MFFLIIFLYRAQLRSTRKQQFCIVTSIKQFILLDWITLFLANCKTSKFKPCLPGIAHSVKVDNRKAGRGKENGTELELKLKKTLINLK
jgi:hypothetical protein